MDYSGWPADSRGVAGGRATLAPGGRSAPRGLVARVARREITTRLRERSFLISTAITLLIIVAVIVLPAIFSGGDDDVTVGAVGPVAAVEPALKAAADAAGTTVTVQGLADEAAARAAVEAGDVDAAFVGTDRVLVKEELDDSAEQVVQGAYRQIATLQRLQQAGIDATAVSRALDVPPLTVTAIDPPEPGSDERRGAAYFGVLLLYFQLIGYGVWVALGVVEEKSSRVVELLLSTLRPWQLLAGKVIGIGLLALGQLVLTAVVGVVAAVGTDVVDVPTGILGVAGQVILWFLLGFAFYACLFAAFASLVSRQEEVQNATTPLTILLLGSFFLAVAGLNSPDSGFVRIASLVPPFSTMVMPIRWAAGDAPLWEVGLSIVLMLVAVVALIRLAGRVYAGAILRSGPRVKLKDALNAGRSG